MKLILTSLIVITPLWTYGQSPTFQAFLALNHNVNNNAYDLKENLDGDTEMFWVNIFFNYYKNPMVRGSMKADESMIFSIGYEYLIRHRIENESDYNFSIPAGTDKDEVQTLNIMAIPDGQSTETKIRKKYLDTKVERGSIEVTIKKEGLPKSGMIKIFCRIESFDFKTLKIATGNKLGIETILSYNSTDIFRYGVSDIELLKLDEQTNPFRLKEFTYQRPPIIDYNVTSYSYKWKLQNNSLNELSMVLTGIDLPTDLGTSQEQILKYSN